MNASKLVSILSGALTLAVSTTAVAGSESRDSDGGLDHAVAPIEKAIEIGVAVGYARSLGDTGGNLPAMDDLSGAGGGIELQAGVRVMPNLTLGGYGSFSQLGGGDALASSSEVYTAAIGLQAAWHFRPDRSIDPWIGVGAGFRGLWLDHQHGDDTFLAGLDVARIQMGADLRVTPTFAISSVTTLSMTTYLSEYDHMTDEFGDLDDRDLSFTLLSGIMGRFDIPVGS